MRFLHHKLTAAEANLDAGGELLAAAGIPVGGVLSPGSIVYVAQDPSGPGRAPVWVLSEEPIGPGAREVPDGAAVVGQPRALRVEDLELVRAAALTEVGRVGTLRAEAPATIPGYPPLGVGKSARDDWGSLMDVTQAAEAEGLDPVAIGLYPTDFPAKDGTPVVIPTPSAARQLVLALFVVGAQRKRAVDAAARQIREADTVDEVATALRTYLAS